MRSIIRSTTATTLCLAGALLAVPSLAAGAGTQPIVDAHMHYSHDAWEIIPPEEAAQVLREARLARAFVSRSNDEGTQMLHAAAPEIVVPVLRPYRRRGETGSWIEDETVIDYVEARLAQHSYAGIGEFHVYGENADLPVVRRLVALAREHGMFLHAHSDAQAVERIFAQDRDAVVLWAHSGFDVPREVRAMLERYPNLWCDLAFRADHAPGGSLDPEWRQLFVDYPERFMVGTDTYTPERWYYVIEHAATTRAWLVDLPEPAASGIARGNAEALLARVGWPR